MLQKTEKNHNGYRKHNNALNRMTFLPTKDTPYIVMHIMFLTQTNENRTTHNI